MHFVNLDDLRLRWSVAPAFVPDIVKRGVLRPRFKAVAWAAQDDMQAPFPPGTAKREGSVFEAVDGTIVALGSGWYGSNDIPFDMAANRGLFRFDLQHQKVEFQLLEFNASAKTIIRFDDSDISPNGEFIVRPSPEIRFLEFIDPLEPEFVHWRHQQRFDTWSLTSGQMIHRSDPITLTCEKYVGDDDHAYFKKWVPKLARWTQTTETPGLFPQTLPPAQKRKGFKSILYLRDIYPRLQAVQWSEDSRSYGVELSAPRGFQAPAVQRHHISTDLAPAKRKTKDTVRLNWALDYAFEQDLPKITAHDIAAMIPGLTKIKSWKPADVIAGLDRFSERLRTDFEGLGGHTGRLTFVFQVGPTILDERQFAEKLAAKKIDVIAAIKSLLDVWADTLRREKVAFGAGPGGFAPLGAILAYLAEHDDHCSAQLRNYVVLRDGEHESFSRDAVVWGYLDRLGFARLDLWRLAVIHALLFDRDGAIRLADGKRVSPWMFTEVLPKARKVMQPADFVEMVQSELSTFASEPNVFAAFGTQPDAAANARDDLLDQLGDTPWDVAVAQGLRAG